ncbi:TIGR04086 family membrane protein [Desulforamulus reducens]|nr:TIGR04086 family membrane protein [Desulforamulus reducens]
MGKLTFVQWRKHDVKEDKPFKKGAVGTGLVRAFSVTLAVLVMMGFAVAVTHQSVYHFSMLILLTVLASAAMGGGSAGAVAGIRGWQHGGMTGLIYGMFLVVAGALTGVLIFDPVLLTTAITIAGTIGGVIGVNLPSTRKRLVNRRYLNTFNR